MNQTNNLPLSSTPSALRPPAPIMLSPRLTFLLSFAIGMVAAVDRPNFVGTARVKQHRHKTGDLVEGEEHLLKVIVKWDPIPGAEGYELCYNCNFIDEDTGAEISEADSDSKIIPIGIGQKFTCGGQPCSVMPGMPRGHNKFHLRVKVGGEMSAWSNYQNFDVQEPGSFGHTEL